MLQFLCDAEEGHLVAATSRTFNLKVVAVVHPETLQTLNKEEIDG
jgi:hypothetical protein